MTDQGQQEPLRLHLGCGDVYLDGYRNIDLPPDEREVEERIQPDELADITKLDYPPGSVAEVRLHHVFEHFNRPTAVRLLVDWHGWLVPGGIVRIETPDMRRSARVLARRRNPRARLKAARHLFGSHEAEWAVHKDGWDDQKFRLYLETLGYEGVAFERSRWRGTHNITATASKGETVPREELLSRAEDLLRDSLVDESESELRVLDVWIAQLREPSERS